MYTDRYIHICIYIYYREREIESPPSVDRIWHKQCSPAVMPNLETISRTQQVISIAVQPAELGKPWLLRYLQVSI